ncbi:hypothetical protein [Moraxella oblonga]|uniref:hypothetical protein n=1 Tax=Moraxella oblonga TaxID=200413 RepID=UPI000830F072|nr:hypothetical protein [Moraxella oblonga]
MNTINNPIRHTAPIPPNMTGRVADIERDIVKILNDEILANYSLTDKQFSDFIEQLPIIEYRESEFAFVIKCLMIVAVGVLFGYWAILSLLNISTNFIFAITACFCAYICVRVLFSEMPRQFNLYHHREHCIIDNCQLKVRKKDWLGYFDVDLTIIDFKDIYHIACEPVKSGRSFYYAINVYYLTYSDDEMFYRKNVIELYAYAYFKEKVINKAIRLKYLVDDYHQHFGKAKMPKIIYVKQLSFEEFAKQNKNYQDDWDKDEWSKDDWKDNW